MKGLLIVAEGLDCSGKTTAINNVLKVSGPDTARFVYSKGIGSNTLIGKTSRWLPSTFMFAIELIYIIFSRIIPNLNRHKIILQDRYDISITSYVPPVKRWYNQLLINILRHFVVKPDAIAYFHLPLSERIKRLIKKGAKYESILAHNPNLITLREKEYLKWYHNFNGPKISINTKKNSIKETVRDFKRFIRHVKTAGSCYNGLH